MANKNGTTGTNDGHTVESVIGGFNEAQINQVADNSVRQTAMECLTLATGIAKVHLQPEDANQELIAASLKNRNITVDDARQLIADGEALLAAYNDRVAKEAAARAASSRSEAASKQAHNQVQSRANIIRGVLGGKSNALELFGVKMLGGRGRGRRKPAPDKKDGSGGTNNGSTDGKTS